MCAEHERQWWARHAAAYKDLIAARAPVKPKEEDWLNSNRDLVS
jgi:hypothetical protein